MSIATHIIAHIETAAREMRIARMLTGPARAYHVALAAIAICTAGDLAAGRYGA